MEITQPNSIREKNLLEFTDSATNGIFAIEYK